MKNIDLLYILNNSSRWNNNEIRYSLRSLKNVRNKGRIFICGYLPPFINEEKVVHIPAEDISKNKLKNAVHKIKTACLGKDEKKISDDFILMNDDFFFLKKVDSIKYFRKGDLNRAKRDHLTQAGYYYKAISKTIDYLEENDFDTDDFEVHYPIVFNKEKIMKVIKIIEQLDDPLLFRSLYGNMFKIESEYRDDCKYYNDQIPDTLFGKDFISTDDNIIMYEKFQNMIEKKLKDHSEYEEFEKTLFYANQIININGNIYNKGDIIRVKVDGNMIESGLVRKVVKKLYY